MSLHIVIDGYNLIRQSRQFSALEHKGLQAGRDGLIDYLSTYKKYKAHKITVVFDASEAPIGLPRAERLKGIHVRYSRPGELADTVIKRIATRERERLLVVSSDADVVNFAAAQGSATISVSEFEDRLAMVQYERQIGTYENSSAKGWQLTTKKKGPARRLSKRQRKEKKKTSKL
jgi:predicted RNA-binding protein with PIN domain